MRSMFALAATFALACTTQPAPRAPALAPVADLEAKTVALVTDKPWLRSYCTGVWVGVHEILTADHCTDNADVGSKVEYLTRGDLGDGMAPAENVALRSAVLVGRDEDHDLALLRAGGAPADGVAHAVANVGFDPVVGEAVRTEGMPLGLWYSYSTGVVSAVRVLDTGLGEQWFVQSTAPISPGNSGGGLFDGEGRLLGVCHASAQSKRGSQNLNLYIHAKYVRAFLEGKV